MKRTAQLTIKGNQNQLLAVMSKIKNKVDEVDPLLLDHGWITVKTNEEREGYPELMNMLKEQNLYYTFFEGREYTKKEIESALYFHVTVPYPWEHDPERDAAYYGTLYENDDQFCNCRKRQISELMLDVKKMKNWHFITITPELIVNDYAKEVILSNGLTGCEFGKVRDYKDRDVQSVSQLFVTNIISPLSNRVRMLNEPNKINCPHCVQGYPRSELIYKKEHLTEMKDFNLTFEHLNAYSTRQSRLRFLHFICKHKKSLNAIGVVVVKGIIGTVKLFKLAQ